MAFVQALPSAPTKNVSAICKDDLVNPVPEVPVQLDLQVSTSTKQCTVRWGQNDQTKFFNCQVKVSVYNAYLKILDDQQYWSIISCFRTESLPFSGLEYSWHSLSGRHYYVIVEVQDQYDNHKVVASGTCRTRACYSKNELQMLYKMAVIYSGTIMREIHEVYRCKPPQYWQNILNDDQIMRPYMKDENGHDCNQTRNPFKHHYVTIVVCKKNSTPDSFCANVLIPLPTPNPFFNIQLRANGITYHSNLNICVEFFYTEDVPISFHKLTPINPLGRGESTPGGLPNDKTCLQCNLFY
uniref:Fibronectin type-III domain-containing protein n=1 Tax=Panagrellus redivivus TaxID=6233 RepID=A0A7E4UVY8_PANRE